MIVKNIFFEINEKVRSLNIDDFKEIDILVNTLLQYSYDDIAYYQDTFCRLTSEIIELEQNNTGQYRDYQQDYGPAVAVAITSQKDIDVLPEVLNNNSLQDCATREAFALGIMLCSLLGEPIEELEEDHLEGAFSHPLMDKFDKKKTLQQFIIFVKQAEKDVGAYAIVF